MGILNRLFGGRKRSSPQALNAVNQWYDGVLDKKTGEEAANADENKITELIDNFTSSYDDGWAASQTLLKIGKPAIPYLIEALKEREGTKCAWAMETLEQMGKKAKGAIPVLENIANDSTQKQSRREEARDAIKKIRKFRII